MYIHCSTGVRQAQGLQARGASPADVKSRLNFPWLAVPREPFSGRLLLARLGRDRLPLFNECITRVVAESSLEIARTSAGKSVSSCR